MTTKKRNFKKKLRNTKKIKHNFINFIKTSSMENIKKNFMNKLTNSSEDICDQTLGEGDFGKVRISKIGEFMEENGIQFPIVIKQSNPSLKSNIDIIDHNKKTYVFLNGLDLEVITLLYIKPLLHLNPHFPRMFSYGMCNGETYVNTIITEKCGLDHAVSYNTTNDQNIHKTKTTRLETVASLIKYVMFHEKNGLVTLPNNITCDVVKLLDFIQIQILFSLHQLIQHNIFVLDMQMQNVFVYWLNDKSYMGNKFIGNKTTIVYGIDSQQYIKIKTYGFIIKIGDVGVSIINPRKDLIIGSYIPSANMTDLDKINSVNLNLQRSKKPIQVDDILLFQIDIPFKYYSQTVLHSVLTTFPYSDEGFSAPQQKKHWKNYLTPVELLKKFKKYFIDKLPVENSKTLIISGLGANILNLKV